MFSDGSIRMMSVMEALSSDRLTARQNSNGAGLWSRDTPFGANGYFIDFGFDDSPLSHHVLTTDGILGRDTLGPGLPMPPLAQAKRSRQSAVVPRTPNPPAVMMSRVKP